MYNSVLKLVFIAFLYVCTTEAMTCKDSAKYTLTFRGEWTTERQADFPPGPHFSPTVGCSHSGSYVMWKSGILATAGVKEVAETGGTGAINGEMDIEIASKNAHKRYSGRLITGGTGSDSISNIEVNSQYPLVSFITMVAPSPDWFLGVHDLNLCNTVTGEWQDREVKDLFPYDAGTDSGLTFTSGDVATNPPVNIQLITNDTEGSLKGDKPILSFGTFTFEKASAANPGTNFNITLVLILCILNIFGYLL